MMYLQINVDFFIINLRSAYVPEQGKCLKIKNKEQREMTKNEEEGIMGALIYKIETIL